MPLINLQDQHFNSEIKSIKYPVVFAALSAPQLNLQMPDASTLKDTLVMSGKEWDRINQQLYRRQLEQEKIKAIREEKEARKQLSKDMVKDWPNTLEVNVHKFQQHNKTLDVFGKSHFMIDLSVMKFKLGALPLHVYATSDPARNFLASIQLIKINPIGC